MSKKSERKSGKWLIPKKRINQDWKKIKNGIKNN